MAVRGHVNGMAGSYVIGWAVTASGAGSCDISILNEDGAIVVTGTAQRHRPDLVSLGMGRTDFAFRIPVTLGAERRQWRVLADGVELRGSPLHTGPKLYDNDCTISNGRFSGWVTERLAAFEPPWITVQDQHGAVVGEARAVPAEPDDPLYGPAHFLIDLQDRCFGCGELRLRLFANGVKFAERHLTLRLEGNLDSLTDESYSGWLVSPDAPARAFAFDVFQNGVLAGSGKCATPREDVRGLYPGCLTPGFALTLRKPEHLITDTTAVSFRFRGGTFELFKGPYVVGSRPAMVLAAQRAAQVSHSDIVGLSVAERAVLQVALRDFMETTRRGNGFVATQQEAWPTEVPAGPRLTILIPVYRGVAATRDCIQSVLAHRNAATDQVVLINDAAPEPEMAPMLNGFVNAPNVFLLANKQNLGFVKTINRGLSFALGGDVLLLNADTVLFAGGLDEMCRVAGAAGVGTVTALSNNATIFSYPHVALRAAALDDIDWSQLAQTALAENAGLAIDVPTGHGFCLLIKGAVLRRVGLMDEGFGRGYGEENDFCTRAANLGYRNVVAAGVLVVHRESTSFEDEREGLLARNLPRLEAAYPEYSAVVRSFEQQDGLRRGRWALDKARLKKAVTAGQKFVLLVTNTLEGGTPKAVQEIEAAAGDTAAPRLHLRCLENGFIELAGATPSLKAIFAPHEMDPLFDMLAAAAPGRVVVHQLLGFPAVFIERMEAWAPTVHSIYYAHDFYPLCPRVTMVNAIGQFCDVADSATCIRCVELGGSHPNSRLTALTPAAHRALFAGALRGFRHVVAPSESARSYLRRVFPDLPVQAIGHPELSQNIAAAPRTGTDDEIVLLGAIGVDKGSGKLLELAGRARLSHPALRFRIIGYTDMDAQLLALGNIQITGKYTAAELPELVAQTHGRLALFLQSWPETYSYTLSEAARFGFIPMVPDIGAPAERVRAAGYGVVFPFPVIAAEVLQLLDDIAAARVPVLVPGATPGALYPSQDVVQRTINLLKNDTKPLEDTASEATGF